MGFKTIDLDTEEGRKRYEKFQKTKSIKKTFEDEENPFIETLAPRPEEDLKEKEEVADINEPTVIKGVVKGIGNLRVRNAPGGDILYLIPENSVITILDDYESWWKIELSSGKIGYVMKQYIKTYTEGG